MNQKVKDFWNRNKKKILISGGGIVGVGTFIILGKMLSRKCSTYQTTTTIPVGSENRKILEEFGAIYKEGYDVPFATKEVVEKFLNERGNTYQIDILDADTSAVWISK